MMQSDCAPWLKFKEKERQAFTVNLIRTGIFSLSLVLIVSALGLAGSYWMDSQANQQVKETLQEIRAQLMENSPTPNDQAVHSTTTQQAAAPLARMQQAAAPLKIDQNPHFQFMELNPDYVGWIKIDDTQVDYPIVRASDNEYYLEHDFERQKNKAGAIFMDYRNIGNGDDPHTLIYGHNMRDQSMFHNLRKFRDEHFFADHEYITVDYLFGEVQYQVFAAYLTSADESIMDSRFDEQTFATFTEAVTRNAEHFRDVDLQLTDQILTLATCAYDFDDARLIVHAKRVN
ncbi:MAG: class B sortase [Clostridia bacterium]|nr:class B sortase [Clostridia bacterium]